MRKGRAAFVALALLFSGARAGQFLSVEEAVSMAMKNNFDILVARNDAEVARVNNTLGNAGMLPSVAVTGSGNVSQSNNYERPSGAPDIQYPRDASNSITGAAMLDWTLYDGGKMFVTKHKLSEIETLGKIQFRDRVLQTVYAVIVAYYDVVRQKQQLASINEVIAYNQEVVTISRTSFGAGLCPKTTLLQAQVDLNVFKENAIDQQTLIRTAKRTLNQLMARDAEVDFEVADSIPLTYSPDTGAMTEKLYARNTAVLSARKQVDVADLSIREINAQRYPKITVNAGYGASQSNNSEGSTLISRSYGPQAGGAITIPLYQSGNVSTQAAAAKLELESANYNLESVKQQVNVQVQNALDEFENQRSLLQIEKENDALAKENLDLSMQRLRLGQSTSLELHQAQESYVDSRTRLTGIEFNLKAAETKLRQLLSEL